MNSQDPTRQKLTWETVHTIVGTENFAIQIKKSDSFWPRYSLQFMRSLGDSRYAPFISVRIERDGSLVRIVPIDVDGFADLVSEAEEWIRQDAQRLVDARKRGE
jgi:hypothetical protein